MALWLPCISAVASPLRFLPREPPALLPESLNATTVSASERSAVLKLSVSDSTSLGIISSSVLGTHQMC